MSSSKKALEHALNWLARREYAAFELTEKLIRHGLDESDAQSALAECQRLALQSDSRYTDVLIRTRVAQGYGSERIRYELQQKHIESDVIDHGFASADVDWIACGLRVLEKKYRSAPGGPPAEQTYAMRQKQKQFLYYRGFAADTITRVFEHRLEGCDDE